MKSLFPTALACVLGLVTACSDSTPAPTGPSSGSSKRIDSDGGTVSNADASVEVPAGALESAATITVAVSDVTVDPPEGYQLAGPAIAFTPHGLSFAESVTLTLPYDSASEQLAVLRLDDEQDDSWEVVDGGAFAGDSATLEVTSFSIYAVAEGLESSSGAGGGAGAPAVTEGGSDASAGAPAVTEGGSDASAGGDTGAGGASAGGDLIHSCDVISTYRLCTDYIYGAELIMLAGEADVLAFSDTAKAQCEAGGGTVGVMCDTTGSVGGCRTMNVDGLPGMTVTNWVYDATGMAAIPCDQGVIIPAP